MEPNNPAPITPQQPPLMPSSSKHKYSKLVYLIPLLLIPLVVFGIYSFMNNDLSKKKSVALPTEWESHSFELLSVEVPEAWRVQTKNDPVVFINHDPIKMQGKEFDSYTGKGLLKFQVAAEQSIYDFQKFVDEKQKQEIKSIIWKKTETKVDGQQAVRIDSDRPGFFYFIQHPKKGIMLTASFDYDFDNNQELAKKIIESFKINK